MKSLAIIAVSAALLLGSVARGQAPKDGDTLVDRITALETEVATLRRKLDEKAGLSAEVGLQLARSRETTAGLLVYLNAQARNAQAALAALDRSESEGFTSGINSRSRETLLAGLRALYAGAQQGLPAVPKTRAENSK